MFGHDFPSAKGMLLLNFCISLSFPLSLGTEIAKMEEVPSCVASPTASAGCYTLPNPAFPGSHFLNLQTYAFCLFVRHITFRYVKAKAPFMDSFEIHFVSVSLSSWTLNRFFSGIA